MYNIHIIKLITVLHEKEQYWKNKKGENVAVTQSSAIFGEHPI